jgi:hypothetical protein
LRIEPLAAEERLGLDAAQLLATASTGNADAANLFKRFAYGSENRSSLPERGQSATTRRGAETLCTSISTDGESAAYFAIS